MSKDLTFERQFGFEVWKPQRLKAAFSFASDYLSFISTCKTEREVIAWVKELVNGAGFVEIDSQDQGQGKGRNLSRGVYFVNRDRGMVIGRFGQKPLREGARLILAHVDSPRIDLKPTPLYETEKLAWFKTQYYGGIKKYHWPAIPLAIHGVIALANGKRVSLNWGEDSREPVLTITDLLPHLSSKQMEKKIEEAIEGEEMNVLIGSRPMDEVQKVEKKSKDLVKLGILSLFNQKYGVTEEDLVSADLEIVPAGPARDLGFDASLIGGYGQDDRVCVYTALKALLAVSDPVRPIMIVLADKEETGSESNTGALSSFIPDFVSEMLYSEEGVHDENLLRDSLSSSEAISADVTVAYDPDYTSVLDSRNTARLGAGVVLEKYTGSRGKSGTSEASAEFTAKIRRTFNDNDILWQTGGIGKVDVGGGGTIAMFLARHNMDVIDIGPAMLSMHSPFEITSKIDIYATFEAYKAFFALKS